MKLKRKNYTKNKKITVVKKKQSHSPNKDTFDKYDYITQNPIYSKEIFNPKKNKNYAEFLKTNRSKFSVLPSNVYNMKNQKNSTLDPAWNKYAGINGKKKDKIEVNLKTKSLRRKAYANSIDPQYQRDTELTLNKICKIQRWWKRLRAVIKIQKFMRGYLFRNCCCSDAMQEFKVLKFTRYIKRFAWKRFKKVLRKELAVSKIKNILTSEIDSVKRAFIQHLKRKIKNKEKMQKRKQEREAKNAFFDNLSKKQTNLRQAS